jgi:hypothetical protein
MVTEKERTVIAMLPGLSRDDMYKLLANETDPEMRYIMKTYFHPTIYGRSSTIKEILHD